MKKLGYIGLVLAVLTGCSSTAASSSSAVETADAEATVETVSVEGLNILAPTGAPGYALLPVALENQNTITLQDGSEALQAAFVNPTPEYDVIIAPTNLGVKLATAGKTTYQLAGVITTGNLYLVGTEDASLDDENTRLALFGENAVPGLVFNQLFPEISAQVTWYDSVTEAQAALLSGNADMALLADPAATATIAKASQNDLSVSKLVDLQEEWGDNGYPQAAMFVNSETVEENAAVYAEMLNMMIDYANGDHDIVSDLTSLENEGVDLYTDSVAYAMVEKAYAGMGINPYFIDDDSKENLQAFLSLFDITYSDDILADIQ